MSRCARTQQLDALVVGELAPAREHELRAHALGCAVCRHELRWLESERSLFAQRAARSEVDQLWRGIDQRSAAHSTSRARVARVLMGVAATALLVLGAGTRWQSGSLSRRERTAEAPMSLELMSVDPSADACYSAGFGIACGPALPASFAFDP